MKILFLSRWFPYPTSNGSKLRIYNLLRGLSQHHDVTLLSFADNRGVRPETPEIQDLCSKVHVIPWKEFEPRSWRARLAILSLKPRSIVDTFSHEMAQAITQILTEQKYDLIIASQVQMAAYYPYFRNIPALFEELEMGLFYDQVFSLDGKIRIRQILTWFKLRMYLSLLLRSFQAVTVVSGQERELIARFFPYVKNMQIIPNCMNIDDYKDVYLEAQPNTIIFTGSFLYHTNYEAMTWFVRDVFPFILDQAPDAQLIITGDHADLPLPSYRNVKLVGYVDDIKGLIASSSVSIAPLWSGGGTRLKILEAMAIGTPVVATTKGAEGLDAQTGKHLFIVDDPEEFSEIIIRIFSEKELRQKLSVDAKKLVREKYNWSGVMPDFLDLMETINRV